MKAGKIPKSLSICGYDVAVRFERLPDDADGTFNPRTQTITLDEDLTLGAKVGTLLHETLHGGDEWGMIFNAEDREMQVHQVSGFLFQVLVENVELSELVWKLAKRKASQGRLVNDKK